MEPDRLTRFERTFVPHLDAAYNLARWLTRNEHDAQDVVQEAYLRALKFFDGFQGGDGRAWILKVVRNTCYTWLQHNRPRELTSEFDEQLHSPEAGDPDPTDKLIKLADKLALGAAVEALPAEFREVLVLREFEGLSYKQIAEVAEVPVGTVMSRLARARRKLQHDIIRRRQGAST